MLNKQALRKNTYLHMILRHDRQYLNPAELNQYVESALNVKSSWPGEILKSQLNPLHPKLFGVKHDPNKLQLAYGLRGLPKLLTEISRKNSNTQLMALITLTDLLRNPLECNRAIEEFNIAKRLESILLMKLSLKELSKENYMIIKRIFDNLEILTNYYSGATNIYQQNKIIRILFGMIADYKNYKNFQAAKILANIALFPNIAESMIEDDYHRKLLDIFDCLEPNTIINYDLYTLLSYLIIKCPKEIYDHQGYYCFLLNKIKTICDPSIDSYDFILAPIIWKCFAFLLSVKDASLKFISNGNEGNNKGTNEDGIKFLYRLFCMELQSNEMLEYVTLAFQHCTINEVALYRCREFWDLPIKLIEKASCKQDKLQLYCLQTLRQITTLPSIKNFVRKVCKAHIKRIQTTSELTKDRKKRLLEWLRKKNYKNNFSSNDGKNGKLKEFKNNIEDTNEKRKKKSIQKNLMKPRELIYRLDYGKNIFKNQITFSERTF